MVVVMPESGKLWNGGGQRELSSVVSILVCEVRFAVEADVFVGHAFTLACLRQGFGEFARHWRT
jgi:hypothetical protein